VIVTVIVHITGMTAKVSAVATIVMSAGTKTVGVITVATDFVGASLVAQRSEAARMFREWPP
jgi:hypothetical protein